MLIQHDLIRSAWIFERGRTRWHQFLHIFQRLYLELLSDIVTHTSCYQGCQQHSSDKDYKQTFLVKLCLAVLGLDSVRKEKCTCVSSKITPVPQLSETTKRDNGLFLTIAPDHWVAFDLDRRPLPQNGSRVTPRHVLLLQKHLFPVVRKREFCHLARCPVRDL